MTVDSKIEHEKIFLNLSFVGNNSNSDIVYKSGWTNSVIIDILQNDTVSDESYSVVNVNDGSLEKKDWQVYNLTTQDGQQFRIPYNIVGGKIDDMQALIEGVVIKISATYSGTLEILIPRDLFGDDTSNQESTSFVLLDGEEIQVIEKRNLCFRTITVNFPSNGSKIIVGDTSDALLTGISNNIFVPPIQLYSNSTYHSGDTAVIQGCTSLAEDHENIQINVMNNKIIQTEYITPKIDGTFSKDIKIAGEQGKTYSISATYGDYTAVPEFPIVILVLIASIIPIILMRTAKIRTG